jgi:LacI family transcriptional regulator
MAVTLRDIALKSGISVSTVSRILNKKSAKFRISKETEKLVLKTAKELAYRPNQLARGLRLKKTHTIGLVAPDIANPFFALIIKGVQTQAHQLGYSLVVCDTDEDLALEIEHVNLLYSKGVDGFIVMPVGQKFQHLQFLLDNAVPLVLVDRCSEELQTSTVVVDNVAGAYEAVDYLAKQGHRRIAIIQGLPDTFTSRGRLQGYLKALRDNGIPADESLIVGNDFRRQNGYIEMKLLLQGVSRPSAVFTTSDLISLGALEAIREEGLTIPEEISIVTFDDIEPSSLFRCPITAVAQPKRTIGEMAVKLLTDRIKNPGRHEMKNVVLKPELVIRESVATMHAPALAG